MFSTENWKRDNTEVEKLMQLFQLTISELAKRDNKDEVAVRIINNVLIFPLRPTRINQGARRAKPSRAKINYLDCLVVWGGQRLWGQSGCFFR